MSNCCCNSVCPPRCGPVYLNTNIVFKDLSSCEGLFVFTPDALAIPGPCGLTGANTSICSLAVNVLKNCKGDYKITLLDDNDCNLACLVVKCSQFQTTAVSALPTSVRNLINAGLPATGYTGAVLLQINANNLNLVGEYVSLEEAGYFYREVCQAYLNLWCGAEKNGIVANILAITNSIVSGTTTSTTAIGDVNSYVYNLTQDLLKARVLALKQLCECGKVCNDQFFPQKLQTPCAALKGCCPKY